MGADAISTHVVFQIILFILSGFLQSANTALNTVNISKIKRDAENEDPAAIQLSEAIDKQRSIPSPIDTGRVIVFALLTFSCMLSYGGMLFSAVHSALGEEASTFVSGLLSYLPVFLVLCLLYMVFCVALPKKKARFTAEETARSLLPFIRNINRAFHPFAYVVNKLSSGLALLSGIDPNAEVEQVTEDEIRMLVDAGEEKGAIEEAERDMIENVFEFNNMTAEDCMTHRTDMQSIYLDDTDENILKTIEETGYSRFPVYEEDLDHILGVLTTRDFLMNRTKDKPSNIRTLLRPVRFVPETVRTDVLFRHMQADKVHMAIVVDEYGGTSGLITMEDLLEEIVGNIYDEYDTQDGMDIIEKSKGVWRVSGGTEIEQFNMVTGMELPLDKEYDTIAGFLLDELGAVPEPGSNPKIDYDGYRFKIEKVNERRIEWVEVRKIDV